MVKIFFYNCQPPLPSVTGDYRHPRRPALPHSPLRARGKPSRRSWCVQSPPPSAPEKANTFDGGGKKLALIPRATALVVARPKGVTASSDRHSTGNSRHEMPPKPWCWVLAPPSPVSRVSETVSLSCDASSLLAPTKSDTTDSFPPRLLNSNTKVFMPLPPFAFSWPWTICRFGLSFLL